MKLKLHGRVALVEEDEKEKYALRKYSVKTETKLAIRIILATVQNWVFLKLYCGMEGNWHKV
jgi:hypothetical protein